MNEANEANAAAGVPRASARLRLRAFARELSVFLGFCALTAVMTWPWVLHLRDAVADRGDPYMIAWTLWWDYHQTFTDPLRLFDANVFYPYRYTLAFSENDYGLALVFFPLFALGVRALTVNAVATFLGFAFCGYGAFRLTRTLTRSSGAAWVAGIVFAFVPYRFQVLSHLHYLFAGWIPLLLEALILFSRAPTRRRATWLGVAFLMNALTCISWFLMTSVPLALTVVLLVWRDRALLRERAFWVRGAVAVGLATLLLLPFLIPYYRVSLMYGLRWEPWEFAYNSPSMIHWLGSESRNKVWHNFGAALPGPHRLFPGMLAPLLALAALRVRRRPRADSSIDSARSYDSRIFAVLDVLIVLALVVAALARGYEDVTYRLFGKQVLRLGMRSVEHALWFAFAALFLRVWLTPPPRALLARLRRWFGGRDAGVGTAGPDDSINSRPSKTGTRERAVNVGGVNDGEAIGVGLVWAVWGFLASLGANFFVNRWLHDYVMPFQSLRIPSRWSMICYAGLAVLAGIGASKLASRVSLAWPRPRAATIVFALAALALLFELHASPLPVELGEVNTTQLAERLKRTPMRGGLVELPSEEGANRHYYMLRAADHARPLVNATASFISPLTAQINKATREGPIPSNFQDLLERIPASYLVVHNERLAPERRADYETFLARGLSSGRLRFVNRFDGGADLYAVTKTEPGATTEAPLPFTPAPTDWAGRVEADPVNMLGSYAAWSQTLYRLHVAAFGSTPRYADFVPEVTALGRGVEPGAEEAEQRQTLETNLRAAAEAITSREDFNAAYGRLDDASYVARLLSNSGLSEDSALGESLAAALSSQEETRAGVLLRVAADGRFEERERNRSLVLLHYFGYFRRNPGDPPDTDTTGFDFWLKDLERNRDPGKLPLAFKDSIEYNSRKEKY
ncbi:MAG TPA: hypothetical protein VKB12_19795 [Pyrinomonadaceae bacterium]|nr:hypothetical protein [Pyrinomonadaceae bacterium]